MVGRCLVYGLLLALAAAAWADAPQKSAQGAAQKSEATLTGQFVRQNGSPVLKVKDKAYRLVSNDGYANAVLGDDRISGRELRLEGRWKGADTFEVDRLFTVRDGKLHKVTYYCHICDITSYKPGLCDCCQQPTEVREVPRDPQGIF